MSETSERVDVVEGHRVVYRGHRFTCLDCGARRMQVADFYLRECSGPQPEPTTPEPSSLSAEDTALVAEVLTDILYRAGVTGSHEFATKQARTTVGPIIDRIVQRTLADERRRGGEREAAAWQAGAAAGHHSPLTWFALRQCNPYRAALAADEPDKDETIRQLKDKLDAVQTVLIENRRYTTNQGWLWDRVYEAIND